MASYNRVILMGNLTRDIEFRFIPSGTAVAEFSIAVNDKRKDASGNWVDEVSYFDITAWARTAEIANEYLSKGSPVHIEGKLKQENWEKDGQKRSKIKVVCDRLTLIGGKGDGSGGGKPGNSNYRNANASADDDAPF